MKKGLTLLLTVVLLLSLAACGQKGSPAPAVPMVGGESFKPSKAVDVKLKNSTDLMKNVQPEEIEKNQNLSETGGPLTDFGVNLFQKSMRPGENTLVSPLSVLYALSMTANGAEGDTLTQMEAVLGRDVQQRNRWLHSYTEGLKGGNLFLANAIWLKNDKGFSVEPEFLQTNANYYNAGIYKAPFDDTTCKEVNDWIEGKTAGMVKNVLDEIPEEAIMYLVNALAFEAKWAEVYDEYQVREETFTTEDGETRDVELMYSDESGWFLEDEMATGFVKWYADYRYAFVALLPNEGAGVEEYVQSLSGEHLQKLLREPQPYDVTAAIPKFETEFFADMGSVLEEMGMTDAFDSNLADFSRLGSHTDGNIYISRVLHKTFISVAEQGTRAGAATVVEAAPEAAPPGEPVERKEVILDRPFVYMIWDMETNTPIFMGTLMDVA